MDYTDEEKRHFSIGFIIQYFNSLNSWDKVKTLFDKDIKVELKTKIKEGFQNAQIQDDVIISSTKDKKVKNQAMDSEIDSL